MAPTPASIRIAEPLRREIRARAATERRSFSGEVLLLVETGLEVRKRVQANGEPPVVDEPVFEPCGEPALRLLGLTCARRERAAVALSGGDRWA
jgi:hypothetical protein